MEKTVKDVDMSVLFGVKLVEEQFQKIKLLLVTKSDLLSINLV